MTKKNPLDLLNDLRLWKQYTKGMCDSCIGLCCYMPVEVKIPDLIRMEILTEFHLELSELEQIKEALKHPSVNRYTKSTGKFSLNQKANASCYFLDSKGRCTIYDKRPDTCRNHPKIGPKPNYCAYYPRN